jgi:hypothetical protein
MRHKWKLGLIMMVALLVLFGTNVYAFNDLPEGEDGRKIQALKDKGIVQGNGTTFNGDGILTNAEGVQLIVKGVELSLAAYLFIKAPQASDSFDNIPNDAWYADSFVIAAVNGLELPRNMDPKAEMSREEYAHYLFSAMMLKGDYPFTKMLYVIEDEQDINSDYNHSIQLLLNAKIIELNDTGHFLPKNKITRQEAAVMLYNTMEFMSAHQLPIPQDGIIVEENVTFVTEKVNEEVNKVTLSWGEQPNAGYRITIEQIVFTDESNAVIKYQLHYPEEDQMYAQVITTPEASVYVAAGITTTIEHI